MVTWDLPSGRKYGSTSVFRTSESLRVSLWASMMVMGMSSGVSSQAYPNIRPWSPAPPVSTPMAMSGDCEWTEVITPQVS